MICLLIIIILLGLVEHGSLINNMGMSYGCECSSPEVNVPSTHPWCCQLSHWLGYCVLGYGVLGYCVLGYGVLGYLCVGVPMCWLSRPTECMMS